LAVFDVDDGAGGHTPSHRCSASLLTPTLVLTAGHCTEGPATDVYVSFDTDLQLDPLAPGISPAEKAARRRITSPAPPTILGGTTLQFSKQHDQGVVVLDAAASSVARFTPAPLPPISFLDRNQDALRTRRSPSSGMASTSATEGSDRRAVPQLDHVLPEERRERGLVTFRSTRGLEGGWWLVLRRLGRRRLLGGYVLGDASYVNSLVQCARLGTSGMTPSTREFLEAPGP
jgi:hypothetical protein